VFEQLITQEYLITFIKFGKHKILHTLNSSYNSHTGVIPDFFPQ